MNGNALVYLGNWSFEESFALFTLCGLKTMFTGALKVCFWDCWNGFLNNRAIAVYLFMEYFLCLWFIAIFIHYLTQKAHFHFLKLVNFSSFWVNCRIMLEPVSAQPLPLRNIYLSIVVFLNKHENINIMRRHPTLSHLIIPITFFACITCNF